MSEIEVRRHVSRITIDANQAAEAYARGEMDRYYKNLKAVVSHCDEASKL